jgi:hypothetical protein
MTNSIRSKLTSELLPGDRVKLPSGIVRTVREVKESEFLNRNNKPILYVMYAEGRTPEWSEGNSGIAISRWELAE